eukprot:2643391-Rhodomonas_salina.1
MQKCAADVGLYVKAACERGWGHVEMVSGVRKCVCRLSKVFPGAVTHETHTQSSPDVVETPPTTSRTPE